MDRVAMRVHPADGANGGVRDVGRTSRAGGPVWRAHRSTAERSPRRSVVRLPWWPTACEVAVVGLVLGLAVALRLPNLMVVPRLTDETDEVILGLRIARGEALPLVGVNTYIGALFNYLVAAGFRLLGPRPEVGRLTVLA